ncbi:MAG: hypothetical protein Q4C12_07600 [Clostridia bacterium]|nr:hypothetical protein [Clostridia bacterium]
MLTMRLAAFAAAVVGMFCLLGIRVSDLIDSFTDRPKSIKEQINEAAGKKKSFVRREAEEITEILKMTGRADKIPVIFLACGICAAVGTVIASLLDNIFLIPALGIGCMFIPVWYVRLTASHYKKDIAGELETAMSIITTAYLRNEDIVTAAEENLPYLNSPIKEVFAEFAMQLKHIDSDVTKAIRSLSEKVSNEVFHEWCDALIACQTDRSLKSALTPIVSKLSDIRVANSELELMIAEPRKEFIIMALLLIANIPIMYFLNKDWYSILMYSTVGKLVLAIDAAAIFISAAFVIRLTKPIEIRR